MLDKYYKTVIFNLKPDRSVAFQDLMKVELEAARNFDGCQYVAMHVDIDQPHRVHLYMIWNSLQDSESYLKWRKETNFGDLIGPYLAGPPASSSYELIQE